MKGWVLILGGTSAIGRATANAFAKEGYAIYLASRDTSELTRIASDISIRFEVPTRVSHFDAEAFDQHTDFVSQVAQETGNIEGALIAFGQIGHPNKALTDFHEAFKIIENNYLGACSIATALSNYFLKTKKGFIIGISSVAGDRGREKNYIYGSAKGGFSLFLQGLRQRLFHANIHVMTVKPGFVDTAMTYGLPGLFLVAQPQEIGDKIVQALKKKRNIIYLPWFWRYIMLIIKMIPESIYKRLSL